MTTDKILALTDAELKACYFSRQKIIYARALATAVKDKKVSLKKLSFADEVTVRTELKKIKGIRRLDC